MGVDGGGRLQVNCLADLTHSGRISLIQYLLFNVFENLSLLRADLAVCHIPLLSIITNAIMYNLV